MTTIKTFTVETAVKAIKSNGGGIGTRKVDRVASIKAFWADPRNATFLIVGRFLANIFEGKTLAEHLINKGEFALDSLLINGRTLPLAEGTVISLKTLSSWGCFACGSAHGSGSGVSSEENVKLLASNEFYYNPVTKKLFTISTTCWDEYVKVLGAAGRFKQVETMAHVPAPIVSNETIKDFVDPTLGVFDPKKIAADEKVAAALSPKVQPKK